MARYQATLAALAAVLLLAASFEPVQAQGTAAGTGTAAAGGDGTAAATGSSAATGSGSATSVATATAAGTAAGTSAASSGATPGAQPGPPTAPPNYWWGTPSTLYTDPKYSYQVYKQGDQYYYKPLSINPPYYFVVTYYKSPYGPLYLSRSKGGKELGQVSPSGPAGSTYAYYFDSSYSGKYYINDYYPGSPPYYYSSPYNNYLEVNV